jgi:signal transduction histidine kinase
MNRSGSDPDEFAAIVAHDLESSLLVLSANAELLRELGPDLNRAQTGHLVEIERTAQGMKRLLTRIRRVSESKVRLELRST